jgi:GTP-binding protein Era
MVEQARSACLDVDVVLWLVEADRPVDTDPMIPRLLEKGNHPVLLVINKIDIIPKDRLLPMIDSYREICPFASILPVSALKGFGVDVLMAEIPSLLPEGPRYYPEDQITDAPERFIAAEMIREQILKHTKDEVPYGVAVIVERFQEDCVRNMIVIDAVINVERDSQKGILIGKNGTMIRQIGQAARKEIERLLGVKVYLELFVRVQKNWSSSGRMMKEFGYE